MPIPTPKKDESRDDFMSRCMGSEAMIGEFPEHKQRAAVCMQKWEDKGKKKESSQEEEKDDKQEQTN